MERKLAVTHRDKSSQDEYLPTGLYTLFTHETRDTVLELAKNAASSTGYDASIVIGEISGELLVDNLKPASRQPSYR